MITIYKYTSPSGKHYIGQTCKPTQAQRAGFQGSGYRHCPAFWRAIQKYGWDNFQYEELEKVQETEEANQREAYYIELYQSNNPQYGYNIYNGGGQVQNYEYTQRIKTIRTMWEEGRTVGEIAEAFGLAKATITYELAQAGIDGKERIRRSAGQYLAKTVYQYSTNLELIATYSSTAEAERSTGIYNIRRSCANNEKVDKPKYKSGGYYWTYHAYPGEKKFLKKFQKPLDKPNKM